MPKQEIDPVDHDDTSMFDFLVEKRPAAEKGNRADKTVNTHQAERAAKKAPAKIKMPQIREPVPVSTSGALRAGTSVIGETLKDQTIKDNVQTDGDFDFLNHNVSPPKAPKPRHDLAIDNYSRSDRGERDMSFAEDMRKVHQVDANPNDMSPLLRYGLLSLSILVLGGFGFLVHTYLLPPQTPIAADATGIDVIESQLPIGLEVDGTTVSVNTPAEPSDDTVNTQEAGETDLTADSGYASGMYGRFKAELSSLEDLVANGDFDGATNRVNTMDRVLFGYGEPEFVELMTRIEFLRRESATAEASSKEDTEQFAAAEAARAEAERLAAADAARAEAERLAAIEAARAEAEQLAAVEAARAEAERLAAAEAARAEAERLAAAENETASQTTQTEARRIAAEQAALAEAQRQLALKASAAAREAEIAERRIAERRIAEREAAELAAAERRNVEREAARKAAEDAARIDAARAAESRAARLRAERLAAQQRTRELASADAVATTAAIRQQSTEVARVDLDTSTIQPTSERSVQPITDNDLQQVYRRFNNLETAIEERDINQVISLTKLSGARVQHFLQIFENSQSLNAQIVNVSTRNNSETISGTLKILNITRTDGSVVQPPSSLSAITLTSSRTDGQWSVIEW